MKKMIIAAAMLLILSACTAEKPIEKKQIETIQNEVLNMILKSNDIKQREMIPKKFTCQGENINPHLTWEDVPEGTKSFALIVDDPDAVNGWAHWLVKDIPADTREIKQNTIPGIELPNDYGVEQYKGPCPPALHRYLFKLYALDVETLDADSKEELYPQVKQHAIAKAELMGKYEKT